MSVDDGLRPLFRKHVPPPVHWQTMETSINRGVPDSNYCLRCGSRGVEGWIEYKATKRWEIDLRPEQIGWLKTRARAGGRTLIAVRRRVLAGRRRQAADELYLFRGAFAGELKVLGLLPAKGNGGGLEWPPGSHFGTWQGGPKEWDWDAVRRAMLA